mgnify:CR=1 FL=1
MSSPKQSSKYEFLQVLDDNGSDKLFHLNLSSKESEINNNMRQTTEFFKISDDLFLDTNEVEEEVNDEEDELKTK